MNTPPPIHLQVALASANGTRWPRWLQTGRTFLRQCIAGWQADRQAAAMVRALQGLDGRLLRDIGIDRSEITSVVAEMTGDADPSRVRKLRKA